MRLCIVFLFTVSPSKAQEAAGLQVPAQAQEVYAFHTSMIRQDDSKLNAIAPGMQEMTVTGKVTDENGEALPGVTVVLKGTSRGTSTNGEGNYSLSVAEGGGTLVFSFIGYQSQEAQIGNQTVINVSLTPDSEALEEVVVVAYGTQKKENLTGAVSTVDSEVIENRPVVNAVEALQGTAPGLTIQQNSSEPGSAMSINIRGLGTLGDASPLVIVDGVASSLDNINPNDIESISVLKDAASAAIYGARAANGVILVTTKRGNLDTKPSIAITSIVGDQSPTILSKPVDSWEYAELRNEALVNSGLQPAFTPEQIRGFKANGPNTNFLEELFKSNALQQNHSLSISGGNKSTSYFISAGYVNQESQFKGPDYGLKRYNGRLNLTTQVNDRIKVGGILAFSRTDIKEHAYWTEWLIEPYTRTPSIYHVVDEDGNYTLVSGSNANSLARLEEGGARNFSNDALNGNLNAEVKVIEGLKLRGLVGGDLQNNLLDEFRKSIDYAPYVGGGDNESSVMNNFSRTLLLNLQLLADYEKSLDKHYFHALAGLSQENNTYQESQVRRIGIPGNDFGVISNGTTTDDNNTYGTGNEWSLSSYFGRLNYSFDERYLLEANFRYDGSSRFASENRWSFFPSFSVGWRIKQEPFMADILPVVNDLKLRASWGQLGNQNIGLYPYLSTVNNVTPAYSFGEEAVTGAFFNVANSNITSETSTMLDVGLDGVLLDGKLTLDLIILIT